MTVLIGETTRFVVQGVTGNAALWHLREMLLLNQPVVGGVNPGRGGSVVHGIPVFDTVAELCEATGAVPDASLIFVPAAYALDAAYEAIAAEIPLVILIAEGVLVHDTMSLLRHANDRSVRIVGPNTPGIISPGRAKGGLMPSNAFMRGSVGMVSRSGTLSYETARELKQVNVGQSTFVGVGGDLVRGTSILDALRLLHNDPETQAMVLIGEIGGQQEEIAAEYVRRHFHKPVFALIVGEHARPGRRMGHAGAIVLSGTGSYREKVRALETAGIEVLTSPAELAQRLAVVLGANRSVTAAAPNGL